MSSSVGKSISPIVGRFFKVMAPDFHTTLRLPPAFCKSLNGVMLNGVMSEQAILTSCKGTWTVEIARCSNNRICFQKGWDKFVQCHGLEFGNFALFEHLGNMHFKVSVFDSTACEKKFSLEMDEEDKTFGRNVYESSNQFKRGRPQKTTSLQQGSLNFIRKVMRYNINHHSPSMYIPKNFWQPNDLMKKKNIYLRGPSGKLHEVELKIYSQGRLSMRSGWLDFCLSNSVKEGDVCLFQLNHTTVASEAVMMDVRVFPAPT